MPNTKRRALLVMAVAITGIPQHANSQSNSFGVDIAAVPKGFVSWSGPWLTLDNEAPLSLSIARSTNQSGELHPFPTISPTPPPTSAEAPPGIRVVTSSIPEDHLK